MEIGVKTLIIAFDASHRMCMLMQQHSGDMQRQAELLDVSSKDINCNMLLPHHLSRRRCRSRNPADHRRPRLQAYMQFSVSCTCRVSASSHAKSR